MAGQGDHGPQVSVVSSCHSGERHRTGHHRLTVDYFHGGDGGSHG